MKKILPLLIALWISYPLIAAAQSGKVFDKLTMPSKILKSDRNYAIYLPPDYETSNRSYPVLYLLHGSLDDQSGWVQYGEVSYIADRAIASGKATAMIIVMLDGNGGHRGFLNEVGGNWNFEDFFFQEMVPYIEKKYRVRAEKRYRAISGLSMGGGATFIYALHHPEVFACACPLSADIGPVTMDDARKNLSRNKSVSDADVSAYYKDQSVISLINNMPANQKNAVNWYIAAGDKDGLSEGCSLTHIAMLKNNIPHEFRIEDGGHNWVFWRASLANVLEYVSDSFHHL